MTENKKWLYLPIDVKSRELEAKTLLAALAADKGWNVVIGSKSAASSAAKTFPKGAFIGLGALKNFAEHYERLKKNGHVVACLDEEGLVTWSSDISGQIRLSPEATPHIDVYFSWGNKHEEIIEEKNTGLFSKTTVSGNPRFDILRPEFRKMFEKEVTRIKQEHGAYILINSNFGSCNHYIGRDTYYKSLWDKKIITDQKSADFYADYINYRLKILETFWEVLPEISKNNPDHTIIVRPHPSESRESWVKAAQGLPNVKVIYEGNVTPWLLGADLVLHNFCTTAIESFCLGTPVIAYRPLIDTRLETELPSLVSRQVFNKGELFNAIEEHLALRSAPQKSADIEHILHSYLHNYRGQLAAEKIIETLDKHISQSRTPHLSLLKMIASAWRKEFLQKIRALLQGRNRNAYKAHKFPPLQKKELEEIISAIPGISPKISLIKLSDESFLVRK